ncbi:DUF1120 domain-containing protein [Pseudomonas kitaguniensis]|uniref:DUF1120 domain-containing protein n=1 Tax=Pseudomonas kitaguniensis TaxID=2607908 RepID=UPI003BA0F0F4
MQPSRALISAAFMLAGASTVMAASSQDLTITGSITPSACTTLITSGGIVDYGKISAQDLHPTAVTPLPEASVQVSVTCLAPTLMALKSADNRPGTAADQMGSVSMFGLGLAGGNEKIGWYTLTMADVIANDLPTTPIETVDGVVWLDAFNSVWQPGWMRTATDPSIPTPAPLALTTFKADVVVAATITNKKNLPITEEIKIDGSATLDLIYL